MAKHDVRTENALKVHRAAQRPDITRAAILAADKSQAARQAVARLIQEHGPQRVAAAARAWDLLRERQRQGLAPKDDQLAIAQFKQERASRELIAFASRLGQEDLATIRAIHDRGGWPAVEQALAQAGLSQAARNVASATVAKGGLDGLGQALAGHLQVHALEGMRQAAGREAATWGQSATEDDRARLHALVEQGGPELAAQALMAEAGLSPAAASMALADIRESGVDGFLSTVVELARRQVVASEAQANRTALEEYGVEAGAATAANLEAQDGDSYGTRWLKEKSPLAALLRDQGFHASAARWYATNAGRLAAQGIELEDGQSPAEFLIRSALLAGDGGEKVANDHPERLFQPRWTSDEAVEAISTVYGTPAAVVKKWLAGVSELEAHHQIGLRLSRTMDQERARRGPPAPPTKAAKDAASRRQAIEAAAAKVGADRVEEAPEAHSVVQGLMHYAEGREPKLSPQARREVARVAERRKADTERHEKSVEGRVQQAASYLENKRSSGGSASTPPSTPARASESTGGGMPLREAISAAAQTLEGGTDNE